MNKPNLVREIAARLDTTQVDAEAFVSAFYETIEDFFARGGTSFRLGGCGTLKRVLRQARKVVNPQDPKHEEVIDVPAHYTISFKPSAGLKATVNEFGVVELPE